MITKKSFGIFIFSMIILVGFLGIVSASPGVTVVSPNGGEFWKGTNTVNWSASEIQPPYYEFYVYAWKDGDPNQDHAVDISGLGYLARQTTWNSIGLSDGQYKVRLMLWNHNTASEITEDLSDSLMTIDNTKPTATISDVSGSWTSSDNITLGCSDTTSGCSTTRWYYFNSNSACSLNKVDYTNSVVGTSLTVSSTHNDYLCLGVKDLANNFAYTLSGSQLKVDATNPTAGLTRSPAGLTNTNTVTYTPTCSDAGGSGLAGLNPCTTYVKFNNGAPASISATQAADQTYNMLNDGTYTFYTIAIDAAGNSIQSTNYETQRDMTLPVISITNAPTTTWNVRGNINVETSCTDTNTCATIKYYYDNNPIADCSAKNFDTDYVASNTVTKPYACAAAKDNAGNIGYSGASQFKVSSTIQGAITAASAGDIINVAAGTYPENVNVNKPLIIQGAGSSTVTVNALSSSSSVFTITANSVNISGFTVSGATGGGQAGIFIGAGVKNCNISDNILTNNYDGIWLGSGSNHNTLESNSLSNNYQGFEIYISSNNNFTNNIANSNTKYGFKIDSGDHNTFTSNTASSNGDKGFYSVAGDGGGSTNSIFINNTANLNTRHGIHLIGSNIGVTLTDNTFEGNLQTGIKLQDVVTNLNMQNNNITNNPTGINIDSSVTEVTTWTVTHNNIVGNTNYITDGAGTAGTLTAENNWFGTNVGSTIASKISENVDYTPWAYAEGLYDSTNPIIGTITISPKSGSYISGTSAISASVSDSPSGIASCEYTLDGSTWNAGTVNSGNCVLTGINTATATLINIKATDNSGNTGTGIVIAVTPDTTAPSITITNPNTNSAQSKTITATGGDGTLTMSVNAAGVTTCDGTLTFVAYDSTTFSLEADNTRTVCYKSIDAVGNIVYSLSNAIAGIDRTAPTINDLVPGNKIIQVGQEVIVNATISDTGSGISGVNLVYTYSNGTSVTKAMTNSGSLYSSTITSPVNQGTITYYITAQDNVGNPLTQSNSYTITVNDLVWDLTSSWNLVSVPKTLTNPSTSILNGATIWEYNPQTVEKWITPITLSPGVGYWIDNHNPNLVGVNYATQSGPDGTPSFDMTTIRLYQEWNLIGHMCQNTQDVSVAFPTSTYNNLFVLRYDKTTDSFQIYSTQVNGIKQFTQMTPGEGYWVFIPAVPASGYYSYTNTDIC